jgi:acetyl/propionyl-CoA carboxylase alpha subunit
VSTAEFLLDADRRFHFLEVNTRLQVEHGVTELMADVDLVREQILVAAGRSLSPSVVAAAERSARPTRHAIEVRIAAEDPGRDFAPAPGRVGRWQIPSGPGVRVDTAIQAGDRVPPDYDPLVAKLLVVDTDRDAAIDRLARALDEVEITGIQTTLPFHRFVARHPGFRAGRVSTGWVEEEWSPAVGALRAEALGIAAQAAANTTATATSAPVVAGVPSPARSGWLAAGRAEALDRWPR